MSEWTPQPRHIRTPHGVIHYGGPCRDDYRNVVTYDQGGGHTVLSLQKPAMAAFKDAQVRYARRSGWSKERIERNPDGRPILVLPGTNRTCETQAELYRRDPNRYARPEITGHTRGLAVDIDQSQANVPTVGQCLRAAGWTQTRPVDEPWHFSYGVTI